MQINNISSSSFKGFGDFLLDLGSRYVEGDPDYQMETIRNEMDEIRQKKIVAAVDRMDDRSDTFEKAANNTEKILARIQKNPESGALISKLRKNLAIMRADRLKPGKIDSEE